MACMIKYNLLLVEDSIYWYMSVYQTLKNASIIFFSCIEIYSVQWSLVIPSDYPMRDCCIQCLLYISYK